MLTTAAMIQWSMVPQIVPDPVHGNQPDLPNTPAYVNPPNGYGVDLNASGSIGIQPSSTFAWTVTNSTGQTTDLTGETPTIDLQQGPYTVQLTVTGLAGSSGPQVVDESIQVKDLLVVSIGDSYASGEGNPVVPSPTSPQWAYSPDPAMNAQNADAHRSTLSAPAQFALQLQQANPHEAVTFVSVAASGATINNGILGPMTSIGNPSVTLPSQISELKSIIGNRTIDVLTVSVGGDDIGFSKIVESLILNSHIGHPTRKMILQQFQGALSQLPSHFAELASAIQGLNPGRVLVSNYPGLAGNSQGVPSPILGPGGVVLINRIDAAFATHRIIPALDAVIASAAQTYGWTLAPGIVADFRTHGYPSKDSWIRTFPQSLAMEGSIDGTLHPNAAGNQDIATRLLDAYLGILPTTVGHGLHLKKGKHIRKR